MLRPLCFNTAEEYRLWREAARDVGHLSADGHCADCTPEYQARMIGAGRCAHPTVTFGVDLEGFIHGYRQPLPSRKLLDGIVARSYGEGVGAYRLARLTGYSAHHIRVTARGLGLPRLPRSSKGQPSAVLLEMIAAAMKV